MHRDLKPENFLSTEESSRLKTSDFVFIKPELGLHELPPGYVFDPTDDQLVDILKTKNEESASLQNNNPDRIFIQTKIPEVDIYHELSNPERLPGELPIASGEKEWYFFTPLVCKYTNGDRASRTTEAGFWRASSLEKEIKSENNEHVLGYKKKFVFHKHDARKKTQKGSEKMDWLMQEYRIEKTPTKKRTASGELKLEGWFLCKIYKKEGSAKKKREASARQRPGTSRVNAETPYLDSNNSEINNNNNMLSPIGNLGARQERPGTSRVNPETPYFDSNNSENNNNVEYGYNNLGAQQERPGTSRVNSETPYFDSNNSENNNNVEHGYNNLPNSIGNLGVEEEPLQMVLPLPDCISHPLNNGHPAQYPRSDEPIPVDIQSTMNNCNTSLNPGNISMPCYPGRTLVYSNRNINKRAMQDSGSGYLQQERPGTSRVNPETRTSMPCYPGRTLVYSNRNINKRALQDSESGYLQQERPGTSRVNPETRTSMPYDWRLIFSNIPTCSGRNINKEGPAR